MGLLHTPPQHARSAVSSGAETRDSVDLRHLTWIPAGALMGWAVAFVFGDLLTLPVDLFYALYFAAVIGSFAYYVRRTKLDLREWIGRRLGRSVLLGVLAGLALMQGVLARPATPHLSGASLDWALLYRGLVYGSVDGLLLFAFPWIVAWRAFDAEHKSWGTRIRASVVAFVSVLLITTTYHLGYRDFRSSKILMPNVGSTIGAVPTLVAANPVGSAVSHVFMHVTSVVHSPESDLFLPPHHTVEAQPEP